MCRDLGTLPNQNALPRTAQYFNDLLSGFREYMTYERERVLFAYSFARIGASIGNLSVRANRCRNRKRLPPRQPSTISETCVIRATRFRNRKCIRLRETGPES